MADPLIIVEAAFVFRGTILILGVGICPLLSCASIASIVVKPFQRISQGRIVAASSLLDEESIKLGTENHGAHVGLWNRALRCTSDEILLARRSLCIEKHSQSVDTRNVGLSLLCFHQCLGNDKGDIWLDLRTG